MIAISFSPLAIYLSWSSSPMAGRRSRWINWEDFGDEAEKEAGELNYEYEWIVPKPGFWPLIHLLLHSFSQTLVDLVFVS
jgi:hypothetical protein